MRVKSAIIPFFIPHCSQALFPLDFCRAPPPPTHTHTHSPRSSVSVEDLRTEGHWFKSPTRPIFFPRIDDSHCDRIHFSLTADHWLCGKAASGLEKILCRALVKKTPRKHRYVHLRSRYN